METEWKAGLAAN